MTQPPSGGPAAGVPTCYRHPDRETWISCQRCGRPICPDCMRDAAVGFQCPSCVTQGARETRQGMAPYGGRRSADPSLTSKVLIGVNAAVWLLILTTGGTASRWFDALALLPRGRCVPVGDQGSFFPNLGERLCTASPSRAWIEGVADGSWWQLVTSAFTHAEIWHIAGNLFFLFVLGPQVEVLLGRTRFLAVYLLSALGGSVGVYWLAEPVGSTVGASGAVFGLLGALVVMRFRTHRELSQLALFAGFFVLLSVIGPDFVSWQGHLGGVLTGAAAAAILVYAPRRARTPVQYGGLAALAVVLLVLIVLRTLAIA